MLRMRSASLKMIKKICLLRCTQIWNRSTTEKVKIMHNFRFQWWNFLNWSYVTDQCSCNLEKSYAILTKACVKCNSNRISSSFHELGVLCKFFFLSGHPFIWISIHFFTFSFHTFLKDSEWYGTIHLRRRHVLGGEGGSPLPMFADARGVGVLGLPTSAIFESIRRYFCKKSMRNQWKNSQLIILLE